MTKNLVIVESPAKARTIERYLGPGYKVLASYGHVRDLPENPGKGQLGVHRVDKRVNRATIDEPGLVEPVPEEG